MYIVICVDTDPNEDPPRPRYFLATRQVFATEAEAEAYAERIDASRKAIVVEGRFGQLRF